MKKDPKYSHNWYSTYLGPANPLITDENDNKSYIYSIPPIDDLDYAAFKHDRGYDRHNATGIKDALFNTSVADADFLLSTQSRQAMRNSPFLSKKWIWAYGTDRLFIKISLMKSGINALKNTFK